MDEIKILVSRDSHAVVSELAQEYSPAMRKMTHLFHKTINLIM
jgi:hypothetical protein